MAKRKPKKTLQQLIEEKRVQRARDLEAVNLPAELASLPKGQDIQISREGDAREGQKAARDLARRLDAFEALRAGMIPGAYDAARRLEHDLTVAAGEGDRGRSIFRVDAQTEHGPIDIMLAASDEARAALATIGPRDALLLHELIRPHRPFDTWRQIVAYITGEENEHAQASAVRAACANLAPHYANSRKAA